MDATPQNQSELSKKCGDCGRNFPRARVACIYCGAKATTATEIQDTNTSSQKAESVARGLKKASERASANIVSSHGLREKQKNLDTLLFLLMFPIALVAMLCTAVMVKRWGRIPSAFFIFDGAILLLFAVSNYVKSPSGPDGFYATFWLVTIVVSNLAMYLLCVRRYSQMRYGMMFGYSGQVAFLMTISGVCLAIGVYHIFDARFSYQPGYISEVSTVVSVEELTTRRPSNRLEYVKLERPNILWDDIRYYTEEYGLPSLSTQLPSKSSSMPEDISIFAPVEGSKSRVWVRLFGTEVPEEPIDVEGILEYNNAQNLDNFPKDAKEELTERMQDLPFAIVVATTPENYRRLRKVAVPSERTFATLLSDVTPKVWLTFLAGIVGIFLTTAMARSES